MCVYSVCSYCIFNCVLQSLVSSMTFGREDPIIKQVHHEMKRAISQEQAAMEERIRWALN